MEHNHRSHKHRKHARERKNVPQKRHQRDRHHRPEAEVDNQSNKKVEGRTRKSSISGAFLGEGLSTPSDDDDYIRRWLVQTGSGAPVHVTTQKKRKKVEDRSIQNKFRPSQEFTKVEETRVQPKGKGRYNPSTDSSLIDVPTLSKQQISMIKGTGKETTPRDDMVMHPHKKQRMELSELESQPGSPNTSQASSQSLQETFEKRTRHKTREDRYEPKPKMKKTKERREKRSKTKRDKKGDWKKASKKAGDDLMHNFSSKSISQERLTMRPSSGLGLFKNGRVSSPAKRRGLPDLAFSEMEFLQHANRYQQEEKEERIKSKSRDKEKRKASRAHEEISAFFKPQHVPLEEISANRRHRGSLIPQRDECPIYELRVGSDLSQESSIHHRSSNRRENSSMNFIRPEASLGHLSASRGHSPSLSYAGNRPESTSKVSWFESQVSLNMTPRGVLNDDLEKDSPIPEAIRKSLAETGIFRDTGIVATLEEQNPIASLKSETTCNLRRSHQRPKGRKKESLITESTSTIGSTMNSEIPRSTLTQIKGPARNTKYQKHTQERSADADSDSTNHEVIQDLARECDQYTETKKCKMTTPHFEPHSSPHQRPASSGAVGHALAILAGVELPQEITNTPISREQIAKNARIKRPSTTLPVVSIRGQNHLQDVGALSGVDTTSKNSSQHETSIYEKTMANEIRESASPNQERLTELQNKILQQNPSGLPTIDTNGRTESTSERSQGKIHEPTIKNTPGQPSSPKLNVTKRAPKDENLPFLGLPLRGSWTTPSNPSTPHPRFPVLKRDSEPFSVDRRQEQPAHNFFQYYRDVLTSTRYEISQLQWDVEETPVGQEKFYNVAEYTNMTGELSDVPNESLPWDDGQESCSYDTQYVLGQETWEPPFDQPNEGFHDCMSYEPASQSVDVDHQREMMNNNDHYFHTIDELDQTFYLDDELIDPDRELDENNFLHESDMTQEEMIETAYPDGTYAQPYLPWQQADNYEQPSGSRHDNAQGFWQTRQEF